MLLDRPFLQACRGLDARYFLFSEDEDICRQARRAGRRVLLEGRAAVAHVGGASCVDEPLIEAQRLFSIWRFYEKWDGRRAAATYHRGTLLAFGARAAVAALDAAARSRIMRTARLFDDAVRSGVDPLVARTQHPSAPKGTTA
jgi:GT2 family glycosyltransferase